MLKESHGKHLSVKQMSVQSGKLNDIWTQCLQLYIFLHCKKISSATSKKPKPSEKPSSLPHPLQTCQIYVSQNNKSRLQAQTTVSPHMTATSLITAILNTTVTSHITMTSHIIMRPHTTMCPHTTMGPHTTMRLHTTM